ncbi:hypothetical protein K503DRAFT_283270 [Rhizopogon vinicolor AM-OR11-026]|uniref:Uncharacterized protein n=1 Tax=Rhizopogon vinicolor AM-OR11-026 TaxID=1314800 RepID=A0A1B7ND57_9AGAM|nr:hypothetical protein K503DRAFT_283270 [Rhizopogon vinicolor AM-OR11-026]
MKIRASNTHPTGVEFLFEAKCAQIDGRHLVDASYRYLLQGFISTPWLSLMALYIAFRASSSHALPSFPCGDKVLTAVQLWNCIALN